MTATQQIKSRERVVNHGEVFTAEREVKAMCDLVKNETERIDSRFLEPACGDGNFLFEILNRKLDVVTKKYKKSPFEWEKYSVVAISSLYGIDILQDNVETCRTRLYNLWNKKYTENLKNQVNEECQKTIQYILERNILCGNALSLKTVDNQGKDLEQPIIFSEWALVSDEKIKRRDFRLDEMLEGHTDAPDLLMGTEWEYDEETKAWIPCPIKEFLLCDYRKIYLQ